MRLWLSHLNTSPLARIKMSNIEHWTRMGRHELVPEVKHDEAARLTVIAHLNAFLSGRVAPAVKSQYENRVAPGVCRPPRSRTG